jgi:hypothetical protein
MSNEPKKIDVEAFREWASLTERYPGLNRALTASFSEGMDFRAACEEKARARHEEFCARQDAQDRQAAHGEACAQQEQQPQQPQQPEGGE